MDYRDVIEALHKIRINVDPVELWMLYGYRFNRAWETLREDTVKKYGFRPSGRVV